MRPIAVAIVAVLVGCATTEEAPERPQPTDQPPPPDGPVDHPGDPVPPPGAPPYPSPSAIAVLDIHAMDLWSQYLPDRGAILTIDKDGSALPPSGFPIARVDLTTAGTYTVHVDVPDHEPLTVRVAYDGSTSDAAIKLLSDDSAGHAGAVITHSDEVVVPSRAAMPVHRLFLGLRHRWFSASGRPARRGNDLKLLMDGEESWDAVYEALPYARGTIALASWWWQSTFEIHRDRQYHMTQTDAERRANTMLSLLDKNPATKRVLIGQFWHQDGALDWVTTDSDIRARGATAGDHFEFMGQANLTSGFFHFKIEPFHFATRLMEQPKLAALKYDADADVASTAPEKDVDLTQWPVSVDVNVASFHQKFLTIDNDVAFIGGMNVKAEDWDTSQHLVFEPRRMSLSASNTDRLAVAYKQRLPDTGPRKDYMVKVHGPSAQDAVDIFKRRWDQDIFENADYAQNASTFTIDRNVASYGPYQVQVTDTLPDPYWEHSIMETWLNAVSNASDYIYIEDQYFRAPLLNAAIARRMAQVPTLKLIVVTKWVSEWTDPACQWTAISNSLFKQAFPGRYKLVQLRSFDYVDTWGWDSTESRFVDIDTHSKMLIVDDKFMSVGSANKNNRGMIYEGEMSVAVLDPGFVRAARRRILYNMMPGLTVSDDSNVWWDQLTSCQRWNDYVYANWSDEGWDIHLSSGEGLPERYRPFGFVYSLDFRDSSYCLIEGVGEDMT